MTDIPVIAEARRLLKIQKSMNPGFLETKLALAKDSHAWAAVYLARWLLDDAEPNIPESNDFIRRSVAIARCVMQAVQSAPPPEPISKRGRVYEPIQHRLTTGAHPSSAGGSCYAEAGGLSDEARREQARLRAGSGVFAGVRRIGKGRERCKPFSEAYPLHWK